MEYAYILDLGYHNKGDEVLVSLDASTMESESTSFDFYCYTADDTVVKNMYNSLAGNSLNVESYSDTTIKGTVKGKKIAIYTRQFRMMTDGAYMWTAKSRNI